jgi:hypothetical protein
MISESGMISVPLMDKDGKLSGKIKCISWNDYKKCGHLMNEKYTFIQDNTVKIIEGNVTVLK